jgi:hypothetical protein
MLRLLKAIHIQQETQQRCVSSALEPFTETAVQTEGPMAYTSVSKLCGHFFAFYCC